jgi:hypothetical protein
LLSRKRVSKWYLCAIARNIVGPTQGVLATVPNRTYHLLCSVNYFWMHWTKCIKCESSVSKEVHSSKTLNWGEEEERRREGEEGLVLLSTLV